MTPMRSQLWAVVLAGGRGTRLSPLTRALYGCDLPKQYAVLAGGLSLLQTTVERVCELVPRDHIVVVAARSQEALARRHLAPYPGVDLVLQPRDLDTGPGVMLPLARILARDPSARVAIFPADHHIPRPRPFFDAVLAADAQARRAATRVTLVGVVPDAPEVDYGWIVPGPRLASAGAPVVYAVDRVVEETAPEVAERMLRAQALWMSGVAIARLSAFWRLARRFLPAHAARLELWARAAGRAESELLLEAIYAGMAPASFGRATLERADGLAVVPVADSGFIDWGSPRRVFQSLQGSPDMAPLLARIVGAAAASAPAQAQVA